MSVSSTTLIFQLRDIVKDGTPTIEQLTNLVKQASTDIGNTTKSIFFRGSLKGLILLVIFSISLDALSENKEINNYIKTMSSSPDITWPENSCDQNVVFDKYSNKKIIANCKLETSDDNSISTYLMDVSGTVVYINNFIPIKSLSYENGYGIVLYSDNDALTIFLALNSGGYFQESYLVDGDILENKDKSGLAYQNLLIWQSYSLIINKCISDFSSFFLKKPDYYNSLYLHSPAQIKIIELNKNQGNAKNINSILLDIIDENITKLTPYLSSDLNSFSKDDYRKRVFIFFTRSHAPAWECIPGYHTVQTSNNPDKPA